MERRRRRSTVWPYFEKLFLEILQKTMSADYEIFDTAGPSHLTHVNWEDPNDQRSVAACFVQGVYILECDRQQKRLGPDILAPKWWQCFGFNLVQVLIDDADSTIFGAVFEPAAVHDKHSVPSSSSKRPKSVIAFRGTLPKLSCLPRDLHLDFSIIKHALHETSRFRDAMQVIRDAFSHHRPNNGDYSNVWLCGHSLGAALAMLAGRTLAEKHGIILNNTFLFNPPYFSAPIDKIIQNEKVKTGMRIASSFLKAGVALTMKGHTTSRAISTAINKETPLSKWTPWLFVNKFDHICSEFMGHFEHRKFMEEIGVGLVGRLGSKHSLGGFIMGGLEAQPFYLIPSANIVVVSGPEQGAWEAHSLLQWWTLGLSFECKEYREI